MAAEAKTETLRKLAQLEGKLMKQFIKECDPDNWTGHGYALKEIGEKQKSLRLLDKGNAKSTYAVLKAVTEKHKELLAPLMKDGKPIAASQMDLVADINAEAEKHYRHLQSLN